MEILTPIQPTQPQSSPQIPSDMIEAGLSLKNIEMLDYLGMKDEMFNPSVMDKVQFLADHFQDIGQLRETDMRLGTEQGMTKLDKIYSYMKLDLQSREIEHQAELIRNQMKKYE